MGSGTAVITGATGGIGAAFARALARRGHPVVLIARRAEALQALASGLTEAHGVRAEWLAADLAAPDGIREAERRVGSAADLEVLVNCAGFGTAGRFATSDLDKQARMLELHAGASTRLCHAALKQMLPHRQGAIINVSSLTAMLPLPGNVTYAGSKAYLLAFSEALAAEVASSGVRVQALCPGFTRTGFHQTEEYRTFKPGSIPAFLWGTPEAVVEASLEALDRGQAVCVPGAWNRAIVLGTRLGLGGLFIRILARGRAKSRRADASAGGATTPDRESKTGK